MAAHWHTHEPDGADDGAAAGAHDDPAAPQWPGDTQGDGADTDAKDGHPRVVRDHDQYLWGWQQLLRPGAVPVLPAQDEVEGQ